MTRRLALRALTWTAALVISLLPARTWSDTPPSIQDQVDAYVKAEMERQKIPGMAVAVVQGGKVVVLKGYGLANVELGVPVKPETIFQAASVSKQFAAAAVMLLVEDGKLSLEDRITKFYPEVPWTWRDITVRHLLTHTSGLPDYVDALDLRKDYTEEDLVKVALGLKLLSEPGTKYGYVNTDYLLLGAIIRKAAGRFYGDLLQERVFDKLGMKTVSIISEEDIVPNRASGYRLVKGEWKNQEWVTSTINTTADGGLHLSVLDLVAWDAAIRRRAILRPASWDAVFTPVTLKSGNTYPYGFGWEVDDFSGQRRHHHGGVWQGFRSYISRYPGADLTVIFLTNLGSADHYRLAIGIAAVFDPKLGRRTEPIPDLDPAFTTRARHILAEAERGAMPLDALTIPPPASDAKAFEEALKGAGRLKQVDLIDRREYGDDQQYRYRVTFENQTFEFGLVRDLGGKITSFGIRKRDVDPWVVVQAKP
jgi:CubicO group peptidase (beta-lactamase class C family)